jgi:uncharacterized protein (TIGR02145 family)
MNKLKFISLAAGLALALSFAFSCSSDDGDDPSSSAGGGSSSSVDGGSSSSGGGKQGLSSSDEGGSSSSEEPSSSSDAPSSSSSAPLCGEAQYNPDTEFCSGTEVLGKCGGTVEYDPATEACCLSSKYTKATQYCSNGIKKEYGSVADKDGNLYKTVVIGTQTWMAENLNYAVSGSKCGNGNSLSDGNTKSCDTYGRLYSWATAMNNSASSTENPSGVQGVCPDGWHIPSNAEWNELRATVGGSSTAGTKLKSTSGWYNSGNGTDDYGFSALPGGSSRSDSFGNVGYYGYWWSATESSSDHAYYQEMYYDFSDVNTNNFFNYYLYSVRCVQN